MGYTCAPPMKRDSGISRHPVRRLGPRSRAAVLAALLALATGARSETVEQLLEAARRGEVDAQYQLGLRYLEGRGVELDQDWAVTWLRRAAAGGHVDALTRLEALGREAGVDPTPRAPAAPLPPLSPAQQAMEAALPEEERRAIDLARRLGIFVYFGQDPAGKPETEAAARSPEPIGTSQPPAGTTGESDRAAAQTAPAEDTSPAENPEAPGQEDLPPPAPLAGEAPYHPPHGPAPVAGESAP